MGKHSRLLSFLYFFHHVINAGFKVNRREIWVTHEQLRQIESKRHRHSRKIVSHILCAAVCHPSYKRAWNKNKQKCCVCGKKLKWNVMNHRPATAHTFLSPYFENVKDENARLRRQAEGNYHCRCRHYIFICIHILMCDSLLKWAYWKLFKKTTNTRISSTRQANLIKSQTAAAGGVLLLFMSLKKNEK